MILPSSIEAEAYQGNAQVGALSPSPLEACRDGCPHRSLDLPGPTDGAGWVAWLTEIARRKRQIAVATCGGMITGLVLCAALPNRYSATTMLMPPQQTQSTAALLMSQFAGPGGSSLAALAGGGLGLKNPNDIYVGLLESGPVADAILKAFDLRAVYHSRDQTEARTTLAGNTRIHSEKNGFISVTVVDRDQARVALMANMYTEQLRSLTQRLAAAEAYQRRVFYEEQLKEAKDSLIGAETGFEQLQQRSGLVQLDAQAKAMIEGLAGLRAQITTSEVELQAQRSFSTDQNPDLAMTERQLASLKAQAAHLEERSNASSFTGMGLRDVAGVGMEYLRAEHELRYRQAMFDLLIKQYDAARLDEEKDAAVIQVIEPASPPDRRSSPQRVVLLLLATAGGMVAGVLVAAFQTWLEFSKSDPIFVQSIRTLKAAALS